FVSVLVLIGILLGVVVFGYDIGRRYVASIYFQRAVADASINGNVQGAEANFSQALKFSQDAQYFRTLAQLNLAKINILLQQQNISEDVLKNQFKTDLGIALDAAQRAIALDQTDYQNWVTIGNVYEAVVPFNQENAYEQAGLAYAKARELNPQNPAIILAMAQLEVAHNDAAKAKAYIADSIKLKSNYTDAIYYLAQLQISEGDLKSAIQSVEALTFTNPNDAGVYFQLGVLRYNNKDYTGASSALQQAILLTPEYANAKYFLGLSLAKLNKTSEAIAQFRDILKTNPDNADVNKIIANLEAGRDPITNVTPTSNPPVKEPTPNTTPETADR
ncbi:MAG: ral transcriptional co-repressor, acts together with Tup1p, glucose repression mediator protein, partial [Candidatus Paceibacter sp.]|nr:ral transcriptional co-repressor, acts together with Tup1p, glucose repression mediator protein [Candidatus Paceibacter sp.]